MGSYLQRLTWSKVTMALAILIVGSELADVVTTLWPAPPDVYEANPISAALIGLHPMAFIVAKLVVGPAILLGVWLLARVASRIVGRGIIVLAAVLIVAGCAATASFAVGNVGLRVR